MFPVIFSIGRLPGWIAQWREMRLLKEPISRPRQLYVGSKNRPFVNIEKR
jgi:citrate synthase